jgi:hypothetical protein
MQFKRGKAGDTPKPTGWLQCREMQDRHFPRNATATAAAAGERRTVVGFGDTGREGQGGAGVRGGVGLGGRERRQSCNTTGHSGSLSRICLYAILRSRFANASLAILRNHDLSSASPTRRSHRPGASPYLIRRTGGGALGTMKSREYPSPPSYRWNSRETTGGFHPLPRSVATFFRRDGDKEGNN